MQVEHNVCIRPFIDNKILTRYRINDNVAIDIGTDKAYPYGEPPRDAWNVKALEFLAYDDAIEAN
jgi:hypothetical protein